MNTEPSIRRSGSLLHLLDFDNPDVAEVPGGRFVQPDDQSSAFFGVGYALHVLAGGQSLGGDNRVLFHVPADDADTVAARTVFEDIVPPVHFK